MTMPTFSFLVPTHRENRPLERCLDSIAWQLGAGDEVIVIGDTADGPLPGVEALVRDYDRRYPAGVARFRYLAHDAGHHCWGHCQLNVGLTQARGEWLHVNDDDDVWVPNALPMLREAADGANGRPMLFRFMSYVGLPFWVEQGRFERNWIGGHCLVAPNVPGKVGCWGEEYSGDFDYLESTINLHGGIEHAIWRSDIICVARPSPAAMVGLGPAMAAMP